MNETDSLPIWQSIVLWAHELWNFLPILLPRFGLAWLFCLFFLLFAFRALKPRLRARAVRFDETMNALARRLRYKLQQADAALEPDTPPTERVLLTWFFRFWTNFASAPSLSVIAIVPAIWMFHRNRVQFMVMPPYFDTAFHLTEPRLLPILCYFGSMGLSYILKRVFKRVRPVRKEGSFGHALRDGSFPSGHSLTAFSFWMMCILASNLHGGTSPVSALSFAVVAILIVFLTGLSRIYMAVHWPSDVAGGYIIGAVWTVVCFFALRGLL